MAPAQHLGETVQNTMSGAPDLGIKILVIGGGAVVGIVLIGIIIFFMWRKNRFNLDVEIKLPRSDGLITQGEWGKGFYDAKNGVVKIKRPGYKISEPMAIFDVRRYLQGSKLMTVIQIAPGEYIPVLSKSYTSALVEVDDTNKPIKDDEGNLIQDSEGNQLYEKKHIKESIIDIKADVGRNKAWKVNWTTHAKRAFSISTFMDRHQTAISIGIVFILCFVGFSILYSKIG
jgi:hypothetical protein